MEPPILPEPDLLERIVTLVESEVAPAGFHQPHVLVRVEAVAGDADAFDLALLQLPEGCHPVDELWGFRAPPSWLAIGVVTFGWCSPPDGVRPSSHPERRRVRATILVGRDGGQAATAMLDDGSAIDEPGEGLITDVLLRCLDLPTAPPPPIGELADVLWLRAVVAATEARAMSWPRITALRHEPQGEAATWEGVRRTAARTGGWPSVEWMDDGLFARQLLGMLPSVEELLARLEGHLPPSTVRKLRAALELTR